VEINKTERKEMEIKEVEGSFLTSVKIKTFSQTDRERE
jgi:hypothetical protein